jgi:GR25 family glycosyltransferase involved in LPS biosynthesis
MKTIFGYIFLFFASILHADISKYFKSCENKSGTHQIRNIDFIYVINLDKRPDRLEKTLAQLHLYGVYPYRFSAVNGYSFSLNEIHDMGVKLTKSMKTDKLGIYYTKNVDGHLMVNWESMDRIGRTYFGLFPGAIGCALSHLSILQDAYDSLYETIWIMEDDIEVLEDPNILSDLIDQLDQDAGKNNWDILFTDIDRRNQDGTYMTCRPSGKYRPNYSPPNKKLFSLDKRISPHFRRIGERCGTHSMIVRRNGMKKILDFMKELNIFLPIDHEISYVGGIRMYSPCENIVSNALDVYSDILNAWDLEESHK